MPCPMLPSFVLGVTGNMDPVGYRHDPDTADGPACQAITRLFGQLFDWLRGRSAEGRPCTGWLDPQTRTLISDRPLPGDRDDRYWQCWRPLDLGDTPVILLSSLAPGIDTLAAEAALDYADRQRAAGRPVTVQVRAPLPFPPDLYRRASTLRPAGQDADWPAIRRRFDTLVERIARQAGAPAENLVFAVPMAATGIDPDRDRRDCTREELAAIDPARGIAHRQLRYRAAGEYVAAHSELLLAAYDELHPGTAGPAAAALHAPGTAAIVHARRAGLGAGSRLLPQLIGRNDSGLVLHIPIDRLKNPDSGTASAPRSLRMLPAHDIRPGHVAPEDSQDRHWQEASDRILRAGSRQLGQLAARLAVRTAPHTGHDQAALRRHLPVPATTARAAADSDAATIAATCAGGCLAGLAGLRTRMGALAGHYDRLVGSQQRHLLTLAILSIACFLLAGGEARTLAGWPPRVSAMALLMGAITSVCAFALHGHFVWRRKDDRQFDYRAIAEGLRVQLYWAASGCAASVAGRYAQRLSGELSWIRSVIDAVSLPCTAATPWFDKLPLQHQYRLLASVEAGWLREQDHYFLTAASTCAQRKETLTLYSRALFVAGALLAGWGAWVAGWPTRLPGGRWAAVSTGAAGVILLAALAAVSLRRRWRRQAAATDRRTRDWSLWLNPAPTADELLRPGRASLVGTETLARHLSRLWALALGVAIALPLACVPLLAGMEPAGAQSLAALAKLALFAGSGLVLVWLQQNFHEENLRRYGAMQTLYGRARRHFAALLDTLQAAIRAGSTDTAQAAVRQLQAVLLELGQEALNENAEWLVMRRSRRIRPISAQP